MKRRWQLGLSRLVVVATALVPTVVLAQPTAQDKETARTLLLDCRAKRDAADAVGALKSCQAADKIMNVPTTKLDLAKTLVALGRLIEARDKALEVNRMPVLADEPEAFTDARREAATLADTLATRIGAVVIAVKRPGAGSTVQIKVDGVDVPLAAMGLPWKVDPGKHVIVATAPKFQRQEQNIVVKEGATLPVEISLTPMADAGLNQPDTATTSSDKGGSVPTWAWISGAAGVVALGVGVAFAVDYASVRGTAADDCPDAVCDPTRYTTADADALKARWNRDLGLSVGLGALGVAGVAMAVYGIVVVPNQKPADAGRLSTPVTAWISGQGAGAVFQTRF